MTSTDNNIVMSAEERVQSLITLTEALSDIFSKENEILVARRPSEIEQYQVEKARLAAAYAQSIRDVARNRALVDKAEPELLQELREITQTFEERAQHQRALLDGAGKAASGVVNAISEELNAREKNGGAYKPSATPSQNNPAAAPICVNENA